VKCSPHVSHHPRRAVGGDGRSGGPCGWRRAAGADGWQGRGSQRHQSPPPWRAKRRGRGRAPARRHLGRHQPERRALSRPPVRRRQNGRRGKPKPRDQRGPGWARQRRRHRRRGGLTPEIGDPPPRPRQRGARASHGCCLGNRRARRSTPVAHPTRRRGRWRSGARVGRPAKSQRVSQRTDHVAKDAAGQRRL